MMRPLVASAIALSFALSGCSGRPSGNGILPSAAGGAAAAAKTKGSLVIRIPRKKRRVRSRYVSPNTQSMSLTIAAASGCAGCSSGVKIDAGLTPGSSYCANGAAGETCTLTFALAPGSYTGSIVTYDGPLAGGSPSGQVLSENQSFPFTVTPGTVNVPTITLDGVPHGITFFPLSNNLEIVDGQEQLQALQWPSFFVAGTSAAARFAVYATDPDGNVIAGPGAPAFVVAPAGGFTASATGSTVKLVSPPAPAKGLFSMTITASSPACASQAACTWQANVGFDTLIAFADTGNDAVELQTTGVDPSNPSFGTITQGVSNPAWVAFDGSGDLFVANAGTNAVTEYAPPYTGAPVATITNGVSGPKMVAVAPNGTLAVLDNGSGNVTVYAKPYASSSPVTLPYTANAIAFDSQSNLWVARSFGIVRFPQPGYSTYDDVVTDSISEASSIAFGASDDLFVANQGTNEITRYQQSNNYSGSPVSTSSALSGLTWISCANGGTGVFLVAPVPNATDLLNTSLGAPAVSVFGGPQPLQGFVDQAETIWTGEPGGALGFTYPWVLPNSFLQFGNVKTAVAVAGFPTE